jgi:hypothetical protein
VISSLGRVSVDDLLRWRELVIRNRALELNPGVFTQEETLALVEEKLLAERDFVLAYDIDDTREWLVSPRDGTIYYTD